jgi:ABC-type uncharacterized transport system fused permease/ATPase subunit
MWMLALSTLSYVINIIRDHLSNNAFKIMTQDYIKQWFKNKKIHFLKFIKSQNQDVQPNHSIADLISRDLNTLVYNISTLLFSLTETTINFVSSVYYLSKLSGVFSPPLRMVAQLLVLL